MNKEEAIRTATNTANQYGITLSVYWIKSLDRYLITNTPAPINATHVTTIIGIKDDTPPNHGRFETQKAETVS